MHGGPGTGFLRLGAAELGQVLPPVFAYWRELGSRHVTALCTRPDVEERRAEAPRPPAADLEALASAAPMMPGAEYLTADGALALWDEIGEAFTAEQAESGATVQEFLKRLNPAWNVVGRVHFNLAENRKDEEAPFAFLATYTSRLSAHGKAQHQPLGQALREYAGAANKERLLSLLLPVQRAAERCAWLKQMVEGGEVFHPLRWSAQEAFRFLGDVPELEQAGVVVRMPATWRAGRPPRPRVTGTVGGKAPAGLGTEALLDFRMDVTLDGETLTAAEVQALLSGSNGLALIRGRWVEVDRERLERTLERFREAERLAAARRARLRRGDADAGRRGHRPGWRGRWRRSGLVAYRRGSVARRDPQRSAFARGARADRSGRRAPRDPAALSAGRRALALPALASRSRRLPRRRHGPRQDHPGALAAARAARASRRREAAQPAWWRRPRCSPTGPPRSSASRPASPPSSPIRRPCRPTELKSLAPDKLAAMDLVITSYGSLLRIPWLASTAWRLVILDEAQAIKNPDAKQTRAAKRLSAHARIALTGTPIENRLGDLWSIFDFINPGLLGSPKEFTSYTKRLAERPANPYGPLRDLVRPYILRRLKTDRSVIADLPDKTEVKAYLPAQPQAGRALPAGRPGAR